jgi:Zn-dependent protease
VSSDGSTAAVRPCASCGSELPPSLLACPGCGRLVHADRLRSQAADAERAEQHGDLAGALAAWRCVLELLPAGAGQHQRVWAKVQQLSALVPAGAAPATPATPAGPAVAQPQAATAAPRTGWRKWVAGLSAVGVLLAKLKWVLLALLGKGKALLIGLTQAKTFLSMVIAIGVYTLAFGWRFALGLVMSIYVHEMGHVVWLRRYGIPATAPMFVPGLGAFVRLKQRPATAAEDARVGLAGPVWGAAAAVGALVLGHTLHVPILAAIARVGAWINLFNLLPVWQLDGGRGFVALSRRQRGYAAGVLWILALTAHEGMLFLLAIAASFRAASTVGGAPERGDRAVFLTYLTLVIGLTWLMGLAGPLPTGG